jgi:hypothetical protein
MRTRGNNGIVGQAITPGSNGAGIIYASDAAQAWLGGAWPGSTSTNVIYGPGLGNTAIANVVVTDNNYINTFAAITTTNTFIKIFGTGFVPNTTVIFNANSVPTQNVTYISSTELRVALPPVGNNKTVGFNVINAGPPKFNVTGPPNYDISFLIVGGGGSGGQSTSPPGTASGGGAGGVVMGSFNLQPTSVFAITVGGGSPQLPALAPANQNPGPSGSPSTINITTPPVTPVIGTITALGGGGGQAGTPGGTGQPGGSGGGHPLGPPGTNAGLGIQPSQNPGIAGITQYGFPGFQGPICGAGGGGGGAGGGGPRTPGGAAQAAGGPGVIWPINGTTYAAGGAGGASRANGVFGTGDGGGANQTATQKAGAGGAGVVILAMPNAYFPGNAPGAIISSPYVSPGITILTYNAAGPTVPASYTFTV